MADLSDVEQALVTCVQDALYPDGLDAGSSTGLPCRVFRGWPVSAQLAADLASGTVNVSVFSLPGGHTTTRWAPEDSVVQATPALGVTVAGNSVTFSGTVTAGQLAGLLIANRSYVYRTVEGDTLGAVLAGLRDAVKGDQAVLVQGATLMLPELVDVVARTGGDAATMRELRRQEKRIRVSVWTGSPQQRDTVSAAVDVALAGVDFLQLADGSVARLRSDGGAVIDNQEEASGLYRRDLVVVAEYGTTIVLSQAQMLFGFLSENDAVVVS